VLPKHVAKLGAQIGGCWDLAAAILKFFVMNCSPRDMLSILCEALDAAMDVPNDSSSFVLLLNALAKGMCTIVLKMLLRSFCHFHGQLLIVLLVYNWVLPEN
jgi:hypothetical protein